MISARGAARGDKTDPPHPSKSPLNHSSGQPTPRPRDPNSVIQASATWSYPGAHQSSMGLDCNGPMSRDFVPARGTVPLSTSLVINDLIWTGVIVLISGLITAGCIPSHFGFDLSRIENGDASPEIVTASFFGIHGRGCLSRGITFRAGLPVTKSASRNRLERACFPRGPPSFTFPNSDWRGNHDPPLRPSQVAASLVFWKTLCTRPKSVSRRIADLVRRRREAMPRWTWSLLQPPDRACPACPGLTELREPAIVGSRVSPGLSSRWSPQLPGGGPCPPIPPSPRM